MSRLAYSLPAPCGRVEIFDFGEGFYTDIWFVFLTPKNYHGQQWNLFRDLTETQA